MLERKIKSPNIYFTKHFLGNYITETDKEVHNFILNYEIKRTTWFDGYWQSYIFFKDQLPFILKDITFKFIMKHSLQQLCYKIKNENSVAICLRFYEETINPNLQSSSGNFKTYEELNTIVDIIKNKINNPVFYIFTMYKTNVINKLNLPLEHTFYITSDNGYQDTIQTLWLQSNCKNHIITNSTYYWWGAKLSNYNYCNQLIYIEDNFLNSDIYDPNWVKF
jgi:hypothetical protein